MTIALDPREPVSVGVVRERAVQCLPERSHGPQGTLALSDMLYAANYAWERRLDDGHWALFAPDGHGLPLVVPNWMRGVFCAFKGGANISSVLSTMPNGNTLQAIGLLIEKELLLYESSQPRQQLPDSALENRPSEVEAWIHLTNGCNLKCDYCFVGNVRERLMTEAVALDVAEQLASTAVQNGVSKLTVKFAGGEPTLAMPRAVLMRNRLESLLAGSGLQTRFALISNGTVLTPRVLEFLLRPNTSLTISLDGYGPIHDTFRIYKATGHGSWRTIASNLHTLRAHGIKPFIAATISDATCHALPDLLRWLNAQGLRSRLNVVRQAECSWERTPQTDANYARLCTHLAAAFDRAFDVMRSPEFSFEFVSALRLCDLHFDSPVQGACGIGFNHIVIRPDGRVVDCPMSINDRGVAGKSDLLDACAKSVSFDQATRAANRECLACQWSSVCAGGCPITNLRINGEAYSRSPFCDFYRRVIPAFLSLLAEKMVQQHVKGDCHAYTH